MNNPLCKVPHTLVLLFGMIILALFLTYLLPQGEFDRVKKDPTSEKATVVVAGSYHAVEKKLLHPACVLTVIPRGMGAAQEIIFFVFLIGGAFAVLRKTGTIDALLAMLLKRLGHRPSWLIAGGIGVFCAGSSSIGMAEEYLPFVPVLVGLCIGLGLDAVTAVGIMCVGYSIGYGVATINPFTVVIAQKIAGLTPTSGWLVRLLITIPFFAIGFLHVWRYARRITRDPTRSLVADVEPDPHWQPTIGARLTITHGLILAVTIYALGHLVYKIQTAHWYLNEMGALFLGLTIVTALIGRLGPSLTARTFCRGAAEMTTTALLIGFARSIQIVLQDGCVVDTIIHGIATPLRQAGPTVASVGMFLVQSICNFFIPSGSGQAYVTMPIMAPLADLVGVERQVAVLAYQFGDGFSNILIPTSAVLVGILAMARIPFDRWFRFIFPFMVQVTILGALILAAAVWCGYS